MSRSVLVLILLTVAACATSRQEPRLPEPAQSSASPGSSQAIRDQAADQAAGEEGSAGDEMLADNTASGEFAGIEELAAPSASETPPEMIPNPVAPEPQIVCERVVPTGSILPVKVCRHQAEISKQQEADQRAIDTIKRNTALGASRL